jgi:hypothetical protein
VTVAAEGNALSYGPVILRERDLELAANRLDPGQRNHAVDQAIAVGAEPTQVACCRSERPAIDDISRRVLWGAAAQAVDLAWPAPLPSSRLLRGKEVAQHATLDQVWSSIADEGQVLTPDPATNRVLMCAERAGDLIDGKGVMDLDEPPIETAGHQPRPPRSISARISSTLQAVILRPNLTGRG